MKKYNITKEELILPEHQTSTAAVCVRIFGMAQRWALVFFCLFSVAFFVTESLFAPISLPLLLAVTLVSSAIGITLASCPKLFYLFGGALIVAVGGAFLFAREPVKLAVNSFYAVANVWQKRLAECGHSLKTELFDIEKFTAESGISEDGLFCIFFIFAMMILGVALALCIVKRVRITPIMIIFAASVTGFLYFGMCESGVAVGFMLASLSAVMALFCYDGVYTGKKNIENALGASKGGRVTRTELKYTEKINSYLGGYVGLAALVITLAVVLPLSGIDKEMTDIPVISRPAMKMEAYIASRLEGYGSGISGLVFAGSVPAEIRETEAEARAYTGRHILEVYSETKTPIYLRQWTGIDYYEDGWHTASPERIDEYKAKFGGGFSPEFLTSELLRVIDESLVTLPEDADFAERTSLGYIISPVYVNKLRTTSALVLAPSYADQKLGITRYGSREKNTSTGYNNYYDGIFNSTAYVLLDKYGMIARLPTYADEDFGKNLGAFIEYCDEQLEIVITAKYLSNEGYSDEKIKGAYKMPDVEYVPFADGYKLPDGEGFLSYRYIFEMDGEEKLSVEAVIENLATYSRYVKDNYLGECEGFEAFRELSEKIVKEAEAKRMIESLPYSALLSSTLHPMTAEDTADADSEETAAEKQHRTVMAIVDYLKENMTYTLTPKAPTEGREYVNAAETFLFDTKEGYCVQYATAAVMLLRAAGIPARYAEGYLAEGFVPSFGNAPAGYRASVRDDSAHAWVEVYYDGFGWLQYEVTFGDEDTQMGGLHEDTQEGTSEDTTEDTEDIESADTTDTDTDESGDTTDKGTDRPIGGDEQNEGENPINFGLIFSLCAVFFIGAVTAVAARQRIISVNKKHNDIRRRISTENGEERAAVSSEIGTLIMKLLQLEGLAPREGERWRDFVRRAEKVHRGISEDLNILHKCEFSGEISKAEAARLHRRFEELLGGVTAKNKAYGMFIKYFRLS